MDQKWDGIRKQAKKNNENSILFSLCECNPTKSSISLHNLCTKHRHKTTELPPTGLAYDTGSHSVLKVLLLPKFQPRKRKPTCCRTSQRLSHMMNDVTCIVYCAHMDTSALCIRVCCMCVLRPLSSPTTSAQKETNTKDTATIHRDTMPKRHADSTQDENPRKRRQLSADEAFVEAARNGDTTAVWEVLDKYFTVRKTTAFDAAHEACRGNHDECLALLLPYVETTQMGFGILLSECVHADHAACTKVLLQHWKSVCNDVAFVGHESKHSTGQSASLCPAMWSDPAVCRVLIDAGADLHTKNEIEQSPLHYACASGALDVVKMLVEAGAGVRDTNDKGWTCLHVAARFAHIETVRYLAGLPEDDLNFEDSDNRTALHLAVCEKLTDVVQVLIDAGADIDTVNKDGWAPLDSACKYGTLDVVKMLVEAGTGLRDTIDEGWTCLHIAACFGHTETVRYLMGLPFVDMNHRDGNNRTALCVAVDEEHTDIVQVLFDAGADIDTQNNEGWSPLHYACLTGALDVVRMLVRAGAEVRTTDNDGCTCLHGAARYGYTKTVRYLVGLPEVELDHRDDDNNSALHLAVDENRTDIVQVLIDAGADIDTQNHAGCSPLHSACASGTLEVLKLLVRGGAGVRTTNDQGRTCLHLAAELGHIDIVRYLVGLPEVELNRRDTEKNYTALQYAVQEKHTEVTQVLLDALYVVFGV